MHILHKLDSAKDPKRFPTELAQNMPNITIFCRLVSAEKAKKAIN